MSKVDIELTLDSIVVLNYATVLEVSKSVIVNVVDSVIFKSIYSILKFNL